MKAMKVMKRNAAMKAEGDEEEGPLRTPSPQGGAWPDSWGHEGHEGDEEECGQERHEGDEDEGWLGEWLREGGRGDPKKVRTMQ